MCLQRDAYLRLACRQRNWLRRERVKSQAARRRYLAVLLYRALLHEDGLLPHGRLTLQTLSTRHLRQLSAVRVRVRCRFSGRGRQVLSGFQLARMHMRTHMWAGVAAPLQLGG